MYSDNRFNQSRINKTKPEDVYNYRPGTETSKEQERGTRYCVCGGLAPVMKTGAWWWKRSIRRRMGKYRLRWSQWGACQWLGGVRSFDKKSTRHGVENVSLLWWMKSVQVKKVVKCRAENQPVTALGKKCSSQCGGKPACKLAGERRRQQRTWFGMGKGGLRREKYQNRRNRSLSSPRTYCRPFFIRQCCGQKGQRCI